MPGKRSPSTKIAPGKVKKIIQTDEDIGKMLAAVPVVVAKMTELFLTNLLVRGGELAEDRGAATLTQDHLASVIREDHRMDFLIPLVKDLKDSGKTKTSPEKLLLKKKVKTTAIGLKSKVKKKDTESIKKKVRKTVEKGPSPSFTSKKVKTITSHLSDVLLGDLKKERESSVNDCGRVLKSNFTITNLLSEDRPQIVLSLPPMDLDEDYD